MIRMVCLFAMGIVLAPVDAGAQNTANVSVQIQPSYNAGSTPPSLYKFVVCIGTAANPRQYGLDLTNGTGLANQFTNLPVGVPVTITVSPSRGYRGWQTTRTLAAGWSNHIQAGLQLGSGGPECVPAAATPAPSPPPPGPPVVVDGTTLAVADTPSITEFKLNGGALVLPPGQYPVLQFKFTGPVTDVRISEMADTFPDPTAGWKSFTATRLANGSYTLPLPTSTRTFATTNSRETVYLQLRSGTKVSRVASASIAVRTTYSVPAGIFYAVAKPNFRFKVSGVNVPLPEQQCTMAVSGNNLTFQAPRLGLAGECIYDLFTDGALFVGWKLSNFAFNSSSGCSATLTRTQPAHEESIAARVRVPVVKDLGTAVAGCAASLVSITLEGPAGNVWQRSITR